MSKNKTRQRRQTHAARRAKGRFLHKKNYRSWMDRQRCRRTA